MKTFDTLCLCKAGNKSRHIHLKTGINPLCYYNGHQRFVKLVQKPAAGSGRFRIFGLRITAKVFDVGEQSII